ncbi:MAG: DUF3303 family protein [Chloroflexota bacterium]
MLFHVTVTHSPDDCPIYDMDARQAAIEAAENAQQVAKQAGVTPHFIVSPAPEHIIYLLLEADRYESVGRFLVTLFPYPSEFAVSPVIHLKDVGAVITGTGSQS